MKFQEGEAIVIDNGKEYKLNTGDCHNIRQGHRLLAFCRYPFPFMVEKYLIFAYISCFYFSYTYKRGAGSLALFCWQDPTKA